MRVADLDGRGRWKRPGLRATACLLACLFTAAGAAAQDVSIETRRRGEALEIEGRARLAAPIAVAWAVLTDYERLPDFIPGIRSSRVVSRDGATLVLEQAGQVSALFFSLPVEARLAVVETPYQSIASRGLSGSFRSMQGRYDLRAVDGAIELRYSGTIVPETWMPAFLGDGLLAAHVDRQFRALATEIARRATGGGT
jgi:carbon monoxide dehydrogenase subunit G